ncbi:MAG: sulfite exporter TauE/SafE family protein [Mariprofundaceae bacterium]|nr:sulfite exporter TauE/SafE family protein [Mariprofundaceae bacterium]
MDEFSWMLPYLALGLAVGFFAGLLGIGGGGIMVPVLTMLFISQAFAGEHVLHLALGTSMASIVITSCSSLYNHHQRGAVRWDIVRMMALPLALGTLSLAMFASTLSSTFLAILFSVFMTYIAIQMFLDFKPKASRALPQPLILSVVGFSVGGLSALVAVGGGTLNVPFLTWCNINIKHAIGTSAALGLPIALAGSMGYMLSGWSVQGLPAYSLGYVYLPAVLLISLVSVFTAPFGVRFAHFLPISLLKKIFASILLLLAAQMLYIL